MAFPPRGEDVVPVVVVGSGPSPLLLPSPIPRPSSFRGSLVEVSGAASGWLEVGTPASVVVEEEEEVASKGAAVTAGA